MFSRASFIACTIVLLCCKAAIVPRMGLLGCLHCSHERVSLAGLPHVLYRSPFSPTKVRTCGSGPRRRPARRHLRIVVAFVVVSIIVIVVVVVVAVIVLIIVGLCAGSSSSLPSSSSLSSVCVLALCRWVMIATLQGVVDLDFCEGFTTLPADRRAAVADAIYMPSDDVMTPVYEITRRLLD
jgi:hypothetical protein